MDRELTTQFEQDLKKLLDYCEADEKKHYEVNQEADHIYLNIVRLRDWLKCPCCGIKQDSQ